MSLHIEDHPEIIAYLDKVCLQVKAKAVREDIRLEVLSHLEELVAEKALDGKPEEEAITEGLRQMGDPERIGRQLHAAHKPKTAWGVIALLAGIIAIGLVSSYALQQFSDGKLMIMPKLACGAMGVAAMIGLYFVDYRKLLRYSRFLYAVVLLLMAGVQWQSTTVNGVAHWLYIGSFGLNVYAVSPYLLLIAIAGMLQSEKPPAIGMRLITLRLAKETVVYMMIPAFFYIMAPALAYLIFFGAGLIVLLLINEKKNLLLAGSGVMALMLYPLLFDQSFNRVLQRFTAFLHPEAYATSSGYMTLRSMEAVQSAGMWGQGFAIARDKLPYAYSDLFFSFLVYSLGWVFGIAVAAIALMFVVKVARMGMKLRDGYAKGLVAGLATVLGIQFAWNLLMCAGLLPILGFTLPMMNWNSATIVELAIVGLMLSTYRRKDMLGIPHRCQKV